MIFKNIKKHTRHELSNDDYHSEKYKDYLSGSYLFKLFDDCPAAAEFAEQKQTPALHFGTASHAAFLEPDTFYNEYYRIPCADDYHDALATDTAIKAYLKERGVKGYSTKKGSELRSMVAQCDPNVRCLGDIIELSVNENHGKEGIKAKEFDQIMTMRDTLFYDHEYKAMSNGEIELSIIADISLDDSRTFNGVKVRLDIINNGQIIDYKTTMDARPDRFGSQAHKQGYYLKMALQYDVACALHDTNLPMPILLAQSKNHPYIAQAYRMTKEQIDIGREQYQAAIRVYNQCKASGFWAYGGGITELPTPGWVK